MWLGASAARVCLCSTRFDVPIVLHWTMILMTLLLLFSNKHNYAKRKNDVWSVSPFHVEDFSMLCHCRKPCTYATSPRVILVNRKCGNRHIDDGFDVRQTRSRTHTTGCQLLVLFLRLFRIYAGAEQHQHRNMRSAESNRTLHAQPQ